MPTTASLGHSVAGTATRCVAEHGGQLALRKWPAGVDAGAVGSYRCHIDVLLAVLASRTDPGHHGPAGRLVAGEPVRTVTTGAALPGGPARTNG
jgi:hypothetical protein